MHIPPRLLRAHMDNRSHRSPLSDKQREREERILAATQTLIANFGRDALTIGKLALALRMAPATIRRHFVDIDSILAEILLRHLTALSRAIAKVAHDDPDRRAAQRAAYVEATRSGWGGLTEPHLLLIRERHTLPEDLAKPVEDMRQVIGDMLAGEQAAIALTLLDTPALQAPHIEAMLAAIAPQAAAPPPAPAPKPAAPAATPAHKPHYRDWKAARRQKKLLVRQARAQAARPQEARAQEARAGPP
jgi:AcrR family transcriptional regulator